MNVVRHLFTDPTLGGLRVVGAAPTGKAARELAEGAGVESFTIERFLLHAAKELDECSVVIVDEAGMVGTVKLHALLVACRDRGAKVILVGDHHQLPEITAGGGFAEAVTAAGGQVGNGLATNLFTVSGKVAGDLVADPSVVDFGGQYAHLIATKIRRRGVFAEIRQPEDPIEAFGRYRGIIISGSPSLSSHGEDSAYTKDIYELDVPILGFCFGHQEIAKR